MDYVKDYVGFKHTLLVKLVRIFKAIKKGTLQIAESQNPDFCQNAIKQILRLYIVPGINYEQTNPALGNETFSLLELYPYQFRY